MSMSTHVLIDDPAAAVPLSPSTPPGRSRICLGPDEPFPGALAELPLTQVQVLHSRICCQLDEDYRTDPSGPHPVTLDRHHELVEELAIRTRVAAEHGAHR